MVVLLILPREAYPFRRIRLKELFMTYFATGGDRIHWIALGERGPSRIEDKGNNRVHVLKPMIIGGVPSSLADRALALGKYGRGRSVLRTESVDVILANDGALEGMIGYALSRMHGKKFAFYLSSHFYDMEKNEFLNSPSARSFVRFAASAARQPVYSFLIRRSDFFHPISDSMGDYFARKHGGLNVYPLPLCPAKSLLETIHPRRNGEGRPFTMLYVGQITPVRKIEFLLEVLGSLRRRTKMPFELILVGKVFRRSYRKKLESIVREMGIEEAVVFIDEVPFEEVPSIASEADLGLSLLPPILAYRISSPTKVVEYMAMGLPVVGNREIEDQRSVIELSGGGFAPPYSVASVSDVIAEMIESGYDLEEMGRRGREWIGRNRNYENVVAGLKEYYNTGSKERMKE